MTESNTLRARNRERPTCFDRPDYPDTQTVNDGWTWDGMLQITSVPNPMSKHCASWAVAEHENPAVHAVPGYEGWLCLKCRHLPTDPRVVAAAQRNAEHSAAPKFNPWAGLSMIAKAAERSDGGPQ